MLCCAASKKPKIRKPIHLPRRLSPSRILCSMRAGTAVAARRLRGSINCTIISRVKWMRRTKRWFARGKLNWREVIMQTIEVTTTGPDGKATTRAAKCRKNGKRARLGRGWKGFGERGEETLQEQFTRIRSNAR